MFTVFRVRVWPLAALALARARAASRGPRWAPRVDRYLPCSACVVRVGSVWEEEEEEEGGHMGGWRQTHRFYTIV